MQNKIKLSDLQGLSESQIEEKLNCAFASKDKKDIIESIQGRIEEHEERFKMSSKTMLDRISGGEIQETLDMANWSIEYTMLQELKKAEDSIE